LLRREGLYHSNINTWLRQRDGGVLDGLTLKKLGREPKKVSPLAREVTRLERENKQLSHKLQQAEIIIDFQKNLRDPGDTSKQQRRNELISATVSLSEIVGKKAACDAMLIPKSTFYRH